MTKRNIKSCVCFTHGTIGVMRMLMENGNTSCFSTSSLLNYVRLAHPNCDIVFIYITVASASQSAGRSRIGSVVRVLFRLRKVTVLLLCMC